jgi:predicted RNase H-like nuclease (RuvC/YqgF family)
VKEKAKLIDELTAKDKLIENLNKQTESLKGETSGSECDLKVMKKNLKAREKELYDLKKENETLKENVDASKSDCKMLSAQLKKYEKNEIKKSKIKQSLTQNQIQFPCEICPKKFDSSAKLKVHVKLEHYTNNSSQTYDISQETKVTQTSDKIRTDKNIQASAADDEIVTIEFQQFSCFYCDREILSELNMLEHRTLCHGVSDFPSLFSLPVRCPTHMKRKHTD